jgi:hypothetical protein
MELITETTVVSESGGIWEVTNKDVKLTQKQGRGKVHPTTGHEAQRGSRIIGLLFL